jgi:hypothetical protein
MAPFGPDNDPVFIQVTDKDDLIRLRDTEQNSWAAIAKLLGLGSPGAARRMYSAVVRPHAESVLVARATPSVQPLQLDGADLDTVREAIAGRTIIVERKNGNEEIAVAKVTSVKDGNINLSDGNKSRTVKATAIIAVK